MAAVPLELNKITGIDLCRGSLSVSRLQDNSGSSDLKFGSGNTWSRMGTFQNMIDITSFSNPPKIRYFNDIRSKGNKPDVTGSTLQLDPFGYG